MPYPDKNNLSEMENLDLSESLQILHEENNSLKKEIIGHLEILTELHELNDTHIEKYNTSKYKYISELCKYEQRINHKLTTIKYDLQKQLSLYKPPILNHRDPCEETDEFCVDDILTLKEESLRVINKINAFINKSSSPCCNIAKDTYDNLSDHTKGLLEDLTKIEIKKEKMPIFENNTHFTEIPNKLCSSTSEADCSTSLLINLNDDCSSLSHANNSDNKNYGNYVGSLDLVINEKDILIPEIDLFGSSKIDCSRNVEICEKHVGSNDSSNNFIYFNENSSGYVYDSEKDLEQNIWKKFEDGESKSHLLCSNNVHFEDTHIANLLDIEEDHSQISKSCILNQINEKDAANSRIVTDELKDFDINDCSESFTESEKNLAFVNEELIKDHNTEIFGEENNEKLKNNFDELSIDIKEFSSVRQIQNEQINSIDESMKKENEQKSEMNIERKLPLEDRVEDKKKSFTAQDKIKKLGLEDRMTIFEKTRKKAPLPDLRLRSIEISNDENKRHFEILDKVINSFVNCVFCHVESPSNFYLHVDDEETSMLDSLNLLITNHYMKSKPPYNSKDEAYRFVGDYCCVLIEEKKKYFRGKIINWYLNDSKRVQVQLVDYGKILNVNYKFIRNLTREFAMIPKLAIRCYLPMLYPPGSTKMNILEKWPVSTINALKELSGIDKNGDQPKFRICFFDKIDEKYAVDMLDTAHLEIDTIGKLLIDLGHATELIFQEDDPLNLVAEDMEIEMMEQCDNLNEVVLGYDPKDEGRICRFTRADGTCFKGENCRLEHTALMRGGFTQDQDIVSAFAETELSLPLKGEEIIVKFTMLKSAHHYYINISKFVDSLNSLVASIQQNVSKYEKFKIMPALGELVLVKHWTQQWMRAKVVDHAFDEDGKCIGVQVFMVDIGDINDVPLSSVRKIRQEHLLLPFQAVECVLYGYKPKQNVDPEEVDRFFYDNMVYREFEAKVMDVSDMFLCSKITYKNREIGKILMEKGFLEKVEEHFFPASSSIVKPG